MRTCAQCDGNLLLIVERTELLEGARTPITTRQYRCLDEKCQEKIDKETTARMLAIENKKKRI